METKKSKRSKLQWNWYEKQCIVVVEKTMTWI